MDEDKGLPRGPIAAVVFIVLLVVGGLWLASAIRADSRMQDCVMSGRTNCAPVKMPVKG